MADPFSQQDQPVPWESRLDVTPTISSPATEWKSHQTLDLPHFTTKLIIFTTWCTISQRSKTHVPTIYNLCPLDVSARRIHVLGTMSSTWWTQKGETGHGIRQGSCGCTLKTQRQKKQTFRTLKGDSQPQLEGFCEWENPNLKWMMNGGTPMTQDTSTCSFTPTQNQPIDGPPRWKNRPLDVIKMIQSAKPKPRPRSIRSLSSAGQSGWCCFSYWCLVENGWEWAGNGGMGLLLLLLIAIYLIPCLAPASFPTWDHKSPCSVWTITTNNKLWHRFSISYLAHQFEAHTLSSNTSGRIFYSCIFYQHMYIYINQ